MHNTWTIDRTMILGRDEIATVLTDLKRRSKRSANSRQNLVIFRLATCCGLRVSEIAGLKLGHVRLGVRQPYIQIPKSIGKGGRARRVPLWWDRGTLDDLTSWKAERAERSAGPRDPFVCSQAKASRGKPLSRFNVRRRYFAACRILGPERLQSLTIHHGRHSFVSHALSAGRSLAAVRDAAGHANISTTSIYAHVIDDGDDELGDVFGF